MNEGSADALTLGPVYDLNPSHVVSQYEVHWGDGSTSAYPAAALPADRTITHTYADGPAPDLPISVDLVETTTPDAGFGGGRTTTDFAGNSSANAMAFDPTTGGSVVLAQTDGGSAFLRYTASGALDTIFGAGTGRVAFDNAVTLTRYNVTIDGSGNILVAGYKNGGSSTHNDFALARYTPDGVRDTTFGVKGVVSFDLGFKNNDIAYGRPRCARPHPRDRLRLQHVHQTLGRCPGASHRRRRVGHDLRHGRDRGHRR